MMASFPALPSIHILPEATCNTHLFSDDGSPDQACVMSHQSYSGVAAAPAPAELCGASDALAAQPGTDRAALKHYSPLNTGIDEDGEAGQGDSDSPSAGSEEPGRRRHPRGRGMAGEAQAGRGCKKLGRPITWDGDPEDPNLPESDRKKIRRRVKNRESARRVQQRRKAAAEDLQHQLKETRVVNDNLVAQLERLKQEKAALVQQVTQLRQSCQERAAQNTGLCMQVQSLRSATHAPASYNPTPIDPAALSLSSFPLSSAGPFPAARQQTQHLLPSQDWGMTSKPLAESASSRLAPPAGPVGMQLPNVRIVLKGSAGPLGLRSVDSPTGPSQQVEQDLAWDRLRPTVTSGTMTSSRLLTEDC